MAKFLNLCRVIRPGIAFVGGLASLDAVKFGGPALAGAHMT